FFYVNDGGTYDTTGATHAAGVVRLVAKGFSEGRTRFGTSSSTMVNNYDLSTSFDPVAKNYYLLGTNRSTTETHNLTFYLTSWNIPTGTAVEVEEVSSKHNSEVTKLVSVPSNK